eukprot:7654514-Pyramimonas_sp.AAC.1
MAREVVEASPDAFQVLLNREALLQSGDHVRLPTAGIVGSDLAGIQRLLMESVYFVIGWLRSFAGGLEQEAMTERKREFARWAANCRESRIKPLFSFTKPPGVRHSQVIRHAKPSTLAQDVADDQMDN